MVHLYMCASLLNMKSRCGDLYLEAESLPRLKVIARAAAVFIINVAALKPTLLTIHQVNHVH